MSEMYVTMRVDARYTVKVNAESAEEARKKAEEAFFDADFGEAHDIEGEPVMVEDSDGNYLWEM